MAAQAVKPFWAQPSHGEIQEVRYASGGFMTKSYSKIHVPPFGLFAKLEFPPCTKAEKPTYATVQMGRNEHLNLNSDLLYINHGCDPSLIFDIPTLSVLAGPKGLSPGDELTFFYASTEWDMAQCFSCTCGAPTCKGQIGGAKDMAREQLAGVWLNGYIRDMLREEEEEEEEERAAGIGARAGGDSAGTVNGTGIVSTNGAVKLNGAHTVNGYGGKMNGSAISSANGANDDAEVRAGRSGPTSRELSGEMGGDTTAT